MRRRGNARSPMSYPPASAHAHTCRSLRQLTGCSWLYLHIFSASLPTLAGGLPYPYLSGIHEACRFHPTIKLKCRCVYYTARKAFRGNHANYFHSMKRLELYIFFILVSKMEQHCRLQKVRHLTWMGNPADPRPVPGNGAQKRRPCGRLACGTLPETIVMLVI